MGKETDDNKRDARRVVFPASFMAVISIVISIYLGFVWTLYGDIFLIIAIFCAIVVGVCAIWPNTWWANMGADWFENFVRNAYKNIMGSNNPEKGTKSVQKVGDISNNGGSAAVTVQGDVNAPITVTTSHPQQVPTAHSTKIPEAVKEKESDEEIIENSKKKLENIRARRLRGTSPIDMPAGPRIYLHVVPYHEQILPLEIINNKPSNFSEIHSAFREPTYNTSGILFPTGQNRYLQIYDKGCVEYSEASILDINKEKRQFNGYYEYHIIRMLAISLITLKKLDAKPPFIVMLSTIELDNYSLYYPHGIYHSWDKEFQITEKDIISKPVIIHSYDDNFELVMKPAFQKLWRAAGQPESLNYEGDKLRPMNY